MDDPLTLGKGIPVSQESSYKDSVFTQDRILSIGKALNIVYDSLGTGVKPHEKIPAYSRNAYDLLKSAAYAYHTSEAKNPKSRMHCAHSLRELFASWSSSSGFEDDFKGTKMYKNNPLDKYERTLVNDMWKLIEYLHTVAHSNINGSYNSYRKYFTDPSISDEIILSRQGFDKCVEEFVTHLELLRDIIFEREKKKNYDPT